MTQKKPILKKADHNLLNGFLTDQDDFPFEVEVVEMLRSHSLDPEHAGFYVDEVTGKLRQFDIRVFLKDGLKLQVGQQKNPCSFSKACINIECKNLSAERPLIVACTKRQPVENFTYLSTYWPGARVPNQISTPQIPPDQVQLFYDAFGPDYQNLMGRDTKQAIWEKDKWTSSKQQNRTDFYERWSQCVMASINSYRIMLKDLARGGNLSGERQIWSIAMLVVPDGTLFATECDEQGKWGSVRPCRAIRHKVGVNAFDIGLSNWPSHPVPLPCFSVITVSALEAFIKSLSQG